MGYRMNRGGDLVRVGSGTWLVMVLAVTCWAALPVWAQEDEAEVAKGRQLVQQLFSPQFEEREAASAQLVGLGASALPALREATRLEDPEVVARATEILEQLYQTTEGAAQVRVDQELMKWRGKEKPAVSVRLEEALALTLLVPQRVVALQALELHGARILPAREFDEGFQGIGTADIRREGGIGQIVLGTRWRGGEEGLMYLARLRDLRNLMITPLTNLSGKTVADLQALMPQTTISSRSAGFLGVSIDTIETPLFTATPWHTSLGSLISKVTPGTAAERGGLHDDDVVTHIDGLPVPVYAGLTDLLGFYSPGDKLYLAVYRDGKFLDEEVEIILGEW